MGSSLATPNTCGKWLKMRTMPLTKKMKQRYPKPWRIKKLPASSLPTHFSRACRTFQLRTPSWNSGIAIKWEHQQSKDLSIQAANTTACRLQPSANRRTRHRPEGNKSSGWQAAHVSMPRRNLLKSKATKYPNNEPQWWWEPPRATCKGICSPLAQIPLANRLWTPRRKRVIDQLPASDSSSARPLSCGVHKDWPQFHRWCSQALLTPTRYPTDRQHRRMPPPS